MHTIFDDPNKFDTFTPKGFSFRKRVRYETSLMADNGEFVDIYVDFYDDYVLVTEESYWLEYLECSGVDIDFSLAYQKKLTKYAESLGCELQYRIFIYVKKEDKTEDQFQDEIYKACYKVANTSLKLIDKVIKKKR